VPVALSVAGVPRRRKERNPADTQTGRFRPAGSECHERPRARRCSLPPLTVHAV